MPKLEKLDNSGKPTGIYKHFSDAEYMYLRKLKNPKWKLIEQGKPKLSRENPIVFDDNTIKDFPENKIAQFDWVEKQKTISVLEIVYNKTNSLALKQSIKDRIEKLKAIN